MKLGIKLIATAVIAIATGLTLGGRELLDSHFAALSAPKEIDHPWSQNRQAVYLEWWIERSTLSTVLFCSACKHLDRFDDVEDLLFIEDDLWKKFEPERLKCSQEEQKQLEDFRNQRRQELLELCSVIVLLNHGNDRKGLLRLLEAAKQVAEKRVDVAQHHYISVQ